VLPSSRSAEPPELWPAEVSARLSHPGHAGALMRLAAELQNVYLWLMPSKRKRPPPRDRLHNWIVTRLRAKGEYAGTIQARDEQEALKQARQQYAENEHDRARIAVRRETR
jgi:hypothetical protein